MSNKEILHGKDDWLFLKEGNNNSLSYLTGETPVEISAKYRWRQAILRRGKLFDNSIHLICPEKLVIYKEKYDGVSLDEGRFANALAREEGLRIIYPVKRLQSGEIDTYPKNDTHFNEVGAYVVVEEVLNKLNVPRRFFLPQWEVFQSRGDLGNKILPPVISESYRLKNADVSCYNNGLFNRGRVSYFRGNAATVGRILIFGDSFSGLNLARIFGVFVMEVLFIHSLSVDYSIIEKFKPDYIVFEIAERFLRVPPTDGLPIESLVIEKCLHGQLNEVLKWRSNTSCPTWEYIDWRVLDYCLKLLL